MRSVEFACRTPEQVRVLHTVSGHPNVVNVSTIIEDGGQIHILMELCEGAFTGAHTHALTHRHERTHARRHMHAPHTYWRTHNTR